MAERVSEVAGGLVAGEARVGAGGKSLTASSKRALGVFCRRYIRRAVVMCLVAALMLIALFMAGPVSTAHEGPSKDFRNHAARLARGVPSSVVFEEKRLRSQLLATSKERGNSGLAFERLSLFVKVRLSSGHSVVLPRDASLREPAVPPGANEDFFRAVEQRYVESLSYTFRTLLLARGMFKPAESEDDADVVVAIDLADSLEASGGQEFRANKPYPKRAAGLKWQDPATRFPKTPFTREQYVLPWTLVQTYIAVLDERQKKGLRRPDIIGGDVWLRYPIRTFWQERETYTKCIVSASNDCRPREIKEGRPNAEDLNGFRKLFVYPHLTNFYPFSKVFDPYHEKSGEETVYQFLGIPTKDGAPRAKYRSLNSGNTIHEWESLALRNLYNEYKGLNPEATPRPHYYMRLDYLECASREHPRILTARLVRSLGPLAEAYRVKGSEDEAALENDVNAFLLQKSLLGYRETFKVLTEDRLREMLSTILRDEVARAGASAQDLFFGTMSNDYDSYIDYLIARHGGRLQDVENEVARALALHSCP